MGIGDIILTVILTLTFAITALILWGEAVSTWTDLQEPPRQHDPRWYFTLRRWSWETLPEPVSDWLGAGPSPERRKPRVPVDVSEVLALLDGDVTDGDSGSISARLRVRLPDGEPTTLKLCVNDSVNARAGTFLPVRPVDPGMTDVRGNTWNTAWELATDEIGSILLDHRRSLGLIDDDTHRALYSQLPAGPDAALVGAIAPTGRVRHGHVEVDLDVTIDERSQTIRGFLRPEDIATARHTGVVQVSRDEEGRRALWPTWY